MKNNKIRRFIKFGSSAFGGETERKALAQSLSDALDPSLDDSEKHPFTGEAAKEAEKFILTENREQKELLDFAATHPVLSSEIQAEILEILSETYDETDLENPDNPFYEENVFLRKTDSVSNEALFANLHKYVENLYRTATGRNNSADFGFYAGLLKSKSAELETLARNLKNDLKNSLKLRHAAWQLGQIEKKRENYLEELYEKIEQFKKLEDLLSSFTKNSGLLWSLSGSVLSDSGFEVLQNFADLLENNRSLQELAALIGRQNAESERYERQLRDKIGIKTEFHPKPAYRGQISGLSLGGAISSVLPSELAMSQNPSAKICFAQKFAEKKLLSYAYTNRMKTCREEHSTEEEEIKVNERKGPVIICADTSGSMHGMPEKIAKTITFALAKIAVKEERKCYLISFSTKIETLDLSEFNTKEALARLVRFLRMSFNGGTDPTDALEHAAEMLHTENYRNADVLVVSDFIMRPFSDELKEAVAAEKENGTKFYSLLIGSRGNQQVTECFDRNWLYDMRDPDAQSRLAENLHELKDRGAKILPIKHYSDIKRQHFY